MRIPKLLPGTSLLVPIENAPKGFVDTSTASWAFREMTNVRGRLVKTVAPVNELAPRVEASPGDVLLIRPGSQRAVRVDGERLWIVSNNDIVASCEA